MSERPTTPARNDAGCWPVALALFAVIFFARAWLIKTWGGPVPYWDDWDATALHLFRSWLVGTLTWADIFAAHNEHRIALTRLADLALFSLDGRWNPWWQLLLNAALHATTAVALLCFCWRHLAHSGRVILTVSLTLLFTQTSGWQNALWGFQSQVYFCSVLSVLALGGLLLGTRFTLSWWLGWCAALLALFSAGSGVLAAAAAFGLGTLLLVYDGYNRRESIDGRAIAPLLVILPIIILGGLLKSAAPQHDALQAHSLIQFCSVFFRCLSWPWVDLPWPWLALHTPLLWLAGQIIRQRRSPEPMEKFIFGLGLLAVLHAAAVAYSRGAGLVDARPLSRYQDPLVLGTLANILALLVLSARLRNGRIAGLIWSGLLGAGLLTLLTSNLALHLPFKRAQNLQSLAQIQAYVATHDASFLQPKVAAWGAHPAPAAIQRVLDDPVLRPVLPREFFDPTLRPPWPIANSPWLAGLSAVGLLLLTFRRPPEKPVSPNSVNH